MMLRALVLACLVVSTASDEHTGDICTACGEEVSLLQVLRQVVEKQHYSEILLHLALQPPHSPRHPPHKVEHIEVLNNNRLWMLLGAIVVGMSLVVIRLEVAQADPGAAPEPLSPSLTEESQLRSFPRDMQEFLNGPWARLVLCFFSLQVAMLAWGIAQEFVMTMPYHSPNGGMETIAASFPILTNRLFSVLFFGCMLKYNGDLHLFEGFWMSAGPALSNLGASWCQYESLKFVSFAVQTIAKTTKLLPVVLINSCRGKPQSLLDYAEAVTLVAAMLVFGLETQTEEGASNTSSAIGFLLLAGLIGLDSLTPHLQEQLFEKHPNLSTVHVMFSMASFSGATMLVAQLCTGQLFGTLALLWGNPGALFHLTVLAASSATVQYFLLYTVKHFGPVVVTIIVSIRQMLSVVVSGLVFKHQLTNLAIVAMLMAFFIIFVRIVRKPMIAAGTSGGQLLASPTGQQHDSQSDADRRGMQPHPVPSDGGADNILGMLSRNYLGSMSSFGPFIKCAVAIHILYGVYAVSQESLATHGFGGATFRYPLFLVALDHTLGALFALAALTVQGLPKFVPDMKWTALPAVSNLVATIFQHWSLYSLLFPLHTLMKTLKILPVMVIGRLFRSRTYTTLDYVEGLVLTGLVGFFVVSFDSQREAFTGEQTKVGVLMMIIYVIADSFTSPLEDHVYQKHKLDPGQMLLGMELVSSTLAWIGMLLNGELVKAVTFLIAHPDALWAVSLLGLCSAAGAYTCTLTVRLFGPAVFVLLMMSRQTMSLVVSVLTFQHKIDVRSCLCLVVVCLLVLVSSIRRVTLQLTAAGPLKEHAEQSAKAAPAG